MDGTHKSINTKHLLAHELACHFPYAVFSVALSFVGAALLGYFYFGASPAAVEQGSLVLFHSFHFLHIVFAATGAVLTFFRYSNQVVKGLVLGALNAAFFCILSDVIMPYLVGVCLGVEMELHICFMHEMHNIIPFLVMGVINGYLLSKHHMGKKSFYSIWSHFTHILVSSLASMLYMISHGFHDWTPFMGILFGFLVIAVVVPCTLSDVVVPMYFARSGKS
jgi:hypothetical protein